MPSPTRAYRQTVPPHVAARRILRALRRRAQEGRPATISDYTQHPETRRLVEAAMAQELAQVETEVEP